MRFQVIAVISARFARLAWVTLSIAALLIVPAALPATPAQAQSVDDGLVGYWPFDATSGSTSADLSGNGNTATLAGGLQLTADVAPTDFANPRALLSTPSSNSYATAPGNGIDNLTDYSIAFWLRVNDAVSTSEDVLALGNRLVVQKRRIQSGQDVLDVRYPLRVYPYPVEAIMAPNVWNHVVITIQGNVTNIYLNGQRAQDETYLAGSSGTPTGGVFFSGPIAPLNGILDDLRIYNRVLSTSEVAALPYNCGSAQGLPAGECRALVSLYRNTDGAKWIEHTNWLQNQAPCSWFGVLCSNGHVFALSLPQNNLRGTLPMELGNLSELVVLQLPSNHLAGDLPYELGNLATLQTLDLYGNQLSGQIPVTLGNLRQLTTLRLHNNQLRGAIPAQIANLASLLTLDLGYNMLTADAPTLASFLDGKQPSWAATQTVAPANLRATVASASSVALIWATIPYTTDGGFYEVLASPGTGQYTSVGKTAGKAATGLTIDGLTPGASYSFLVRTFTPKHGSQQNDLLSNSGDPVSISVTPTNHPPVAANDSYSTAQDTPLTVDAAHGLLANDSDPDGDKLTVGSISSVTPGSQLALNPDGSFTYTPAAGFAGSETFTYQASDGQLLSNQASVTIAVGPANHAPVAASLTIAAKQGAAATITLSAADADNDPLTYSLASQPAHGTLSGAAPNLTYTPNTGYTGADSFTYKASDGKLDSNIATVSIQVGAAPAYLPTITFAGGACLSNTAAQGVVSLTLADPGVPAAQLTLTARSSNQRLLPDSALVLGGSGAQRTLTLSGAANRSGSATITLTVGDGHASATLPLQARIGTSGGDSLSGSSGSDLLFGLGGGDTLRGKGGRDLLCGGAGNDILAGGADADVFSGGAGTDRALDFAAADGDTSDGTLP